MVEATQTHTSHPHGLKPYTAAEIWDFVATYTNLKGYPCCGCAYNFNTKMTMVGCGECVYFLCGLCDEKFDVKRGNSTKFATHKSDDDHALLWTSKDQRIKANAASDGNYKCGLCFGEGSAYTTYECKPCGIQMCEDCHFKDRLPVEGLPPTHDQLWLHPHGLQLLDKAGRKGIDPHVPALGVQCYAMKCTNNLNQINGGQNFSCGPCKQHICFDCANQCPLSN